MIHKQAPCVHASSQPCMHATCSCHMLTSRHHVCPLRLLRHCILYVPPACALYLSLLQIKATPVKVFVIHLDVVTADLIVHRVSISSMYKDHAPRVRGG